MTKKDCTNGSYEGDISEDKRHGNGNMNYNDGSVYCGNWIMGLCNGNGTFKSSDGSIYCGEWADDVQHGNGHYKDSDGNQYQVTFVNGNICGHGTMKAVNGDEYLGSWCDNDMNGSGEMKYNDGGIYSGEWQLGLRHGQGEMRFSNNDKYTGLWSSGVRQGCLGTMVYASGDVYSGQWMDDKRHGDGVMRYATGDLFSGMWHRDRRLGEGSMYWAGCVLVTALESSSVNVEECSFLSGLPRVYCGQWMDDLPHGHGVMKWGCLSHVNNIATFSDITVNSLLESPDAKIGSYIAADEWIVGSSHYLYEGQWESGVRTGYGIFLDAQGGVFEGYWDKNMMHGVVGTYRYAAHCVGNSSHGDIRTSDSISIDQNSNHNNTFSGTERAVITPISYHGEWYANHYHGSGIITYRVSGSLSVVVEVGEWCEGHRVK